MLYEYLDSFKEPLKYSYSKSILMKGEVDL